MVENTGESVQHPEVGKKRDAQERFYERWWHWLTESSTAEKRANEEARAKLRELSAPELKRIGAKQALYGVALHPLHWVGYGLGTVVGGAGGFVAGAVGGGVVGALAGATTFVEFGAVAAFPAVAGAGIGMVVGGIGGYQLGVEAAGWAYNRFIRKTDKELPPLENIDWWVGQLPPFNPPMIAGFRNLIDGFFGMKA